MFLSRYMGNKKIKAFLLAPLVPAFIFSIAATFISSENIKDEMVKEILLSFYIWLTFAIPFSYIAIITMGVPAYLILDYKNIKSVLIYFVVSAIIGGVVGWFIHVLFGADEIIEYFIGFVLGAILGFTAGYSFFKLSK